MTDSFGIQLTSGHYIGSDEGTLIVQLAGHEGVELEGREAYAFGVALQGLQMLMKPKPVPTVGLLYCSEKPGQYLVQYSSGPKRKAFVQVGSIMVEMTLPEYEEFSNLVQDYVGLR